MTDRMKPYHLNDKTSQMVRFLHLKRKIAVSYTHLDVYKRQRLDYGWNLVIVMALTLAMFIYLKYSKQGYEIAVVGESENTARYAGINVKLSLIHI